MKLRQRISLDCRDGVHAGCGICDCRCHNPGVLESQLLCLHEWHEDNQAADDSHHCTRPSDHTGPHTCGWCDTLDR